MPADALGSAKTASSEAILPGRPNRANIACYSIRRRL